MSKPFDVVVFGATGFTGALIARYLLQSPEAGLSWAIAGRSTAKLEQVKQQLKDKLPSVDAATIDAVPVLVADSSNEAQLVELVKKAKVVLTVVGPYKLYGELLVKACAENGVHYCDLTAETIWVESMITKYEAAAVQSGAILVHCCGFESVPSDLVTFLLVESVKKTRNSATSQVTLALTQLDGGPSGGTVASLLGISNAELAQAADPYHLTDDKTRAQSVVNGLAVKNAGSLVVAKEKDLGLWSSMFIGGSVNQAVVHRSNFLQNRAYGDQFVYRERSAMGGLVAQVVVTIITVVVTTLLYFDLTRTVIKKFAPQPGEGPSDDVVANGKFSAVAVAYDASGKLAARATALGQGSPGYGMTSKVIAQCAICLAKRELTSKDLKGGFHTAVSAFGHHLITRLREKNILAIDVQPVNQ